MKKIISFLLALTFYFSLFATSAFAITVYDGGKDNLDRWTISFKLYDDSEDDIALILNEYCKEHDCEIVDISLTSSNRVIFVAAIMEK